VMQPASGEVAHSTGWDSLLAVPKHWWFRVTVRWQEWRLLWYIAKAQGEKISYMGIAGVGILRLAKPGLEGEGVW